MATLQIELTAREEERLRALEAETGKSQSELAYMALKHLLEREVEIVKPNPGLTDEERLKRLRAAWGMRADRTDLPEDIHEWRKTQERPLPEWP